MMSDYTWTRVHKTIKCGVCKAEIMPTNRMQKFCPECSAKRKKEYDKIYNQKRNQKQINKAFKDAGVML